MVKMKTLRDFIEQHEPHGGPDYNRGFRDCKASILGTMDHIDENPTMPKMISFEMMKLRDDMAGRAMMGEMANPEREWNEANLPDLCRWAYEVADRMLRERGE
jgi:hypothetical protein